MSNLLNSLVLTLNGGKGSGNFGHTGRPGMVGGSGGKGSSHSDDSSANGPKKSGSKKEGKTGKSKKLPTELESEYRDTIGDGLYLLDDIDAELTNTDQGDLGEKFVDLAHKVNDKYLLPKDSITAEEAKWSSETALKGLKELVRSNEDKMNDTSKEYAQEAIEKFEESLEILKNTDK